MVIQDQQNDNIMDKVTEDYVSEHLEIETEKNHICQLTDKVKYVPSHLSNQ